MERPATAVEGLAAGTTNGNPSDGNRPTKRQRVCEQQDLEPIEQSPLLALPDALFQLVFEVLGPAAAWPLRAVSRRFRWIISEQRWKALEISVSQRNGKVHYQDSLLRLVVARAFKLDRGCALRITINAHGARRMARLPDSASAGPGDRAGGLPRIPGVTLECTGLIETAFVVRVCNEASGGLGSVSVSGPCMCTFLSGTSAVFLTYAALFPWFPKEHSSVDGDGGGDGGGDGDGGAEAAGAGEARAPNALESVEVLSGHERPRDGCPPPPSLWLQIPSWEALAEHFRWPAIFPHFPSLRRLRLPPGFVMRPQSAPAFAAQFPRLQSASLTFAPWVPVLLRALPALEELSLMAGPRGLSIYDALEVSKTLEGIAECFRTPSALKIIDVHIALHDEPEDNDQVEMELAGLASVLRAAGTRLRRVDLKLGDSRPLSPALAATLGALADVPQLLSVRLVCCAEWERELRTFSALAPLGERLSLEVTVPWDDDEDEADVGGDDAGVDSGLACSVSVAEARLGRALRTHGAHLTVRAEPDATEDECEGLGYEPFSATPYGKSSLQRTCSRSFFCGLQPCSLQRRAPRTFSVAFPSQAQLAVASNPAAAPQQPSSPVLDLVRSKGALGWILAGACIGLVAGIGGALIGLGGAFLIIPLVTGLLKFDQHEACGTALLAVVATATMGGWTYFSKGAVIPMYSALLTISALLTARFGAIVASRMDGGFLRRALGCWWMLAAVRIGSKAIGFSARAAASAGSVSPLARATFATAGMLLRECWQTAAALLATGGVAGFLAGLLGIGGSTVTIPVLVSCGLLQQAAQGTALVAMVVPALVGAATHFQSGHVRTDIAPGLLLGVLAGAKIGGTIACALPERIVKLLFCSMLFYIGSNMAGVRKFGRFVLRRLGFRLEKTKAPAEAPAAAAAAPSESEEDVTPIDLSLDLSMEHAEVEVAPVLSVDPVPSTSPRR
eukprot:tig00001001_g6204.t1